MGSGAASRWLRLGLLALGLWLLSGCDLDGETFVVDTLVDAPAANPGDGTCESTVGGCTLRAAIQEANARPHADAIHIGDGHSYVLTVAGAGEDAAASGDLDLTQSVVITGRSTIDAAGLDRVLDVHAGTATLIGPTISGGVAPNGAGIRVGDGAALLAVGVEVRENTATSAIGAGGIRAGTGAVSLVFSAVTENSGVAAGGIRTAGPLSLQHATVSGNTAGVFGTGGIRVGDGAPPAELRWSTVAENGGGVGGIEGPARLAATAVIGQPGGPACAGPVASDGSNADSDGTCVDGAVSGDRPMVDARLGPLDVNGGTTRNHLPRFGSALLDAVPAGTLGCGTGLDAVDQRLEPRPTDGTVDGTAACDIGATELAPSFVELVVNHGGDDVDASPGDGTCQDAAGPPGACSLRAAIDEANARSDLDVAIVRIDPTVDTVALSRAGSDEDANQTGDIDIHTDLAILAEGTTVDAAGLDRALHVHTGRVEARGLVITGGLATTGGGIRVERDATLELVESTVVDNESRITLLPPSGLFENRLFDSGFFCASGLGDCGGAGGGGGIWSVGTLHLSRSSVHDNRSTGGGCTTVRLTWDLWDTLCHWAQGGGVYATDGTITNTTISSNTVERGSGAGLTVAQRTVTVTASTVTGNTVLHLTATGPSAHQIDRCCQEPPGPGVHDLPTPGTLVLAGSIVGPADPEAGVAGALCAPGVVSAGHNLAADGSCDLDAIGDQPDADPQLGPLADHGGPTATHVPAGTSPAVDAIPIGTPTRCDGTLPTDQRGVARPVGDGCDIGAVER